MTTWNRSGDAPSDRTYHTQRVPLYAHPWRRLVPLRRMAVQRVRPPALAGEARSEHLSILRGRDNVPCLRQIHKGTRRRYLHPLRTDARVAGMTCPNCERPVREDTPDWCWSCDQPTWLEDADEPRIRPDRVWLIGHTVTWTVLVLAAYHAARRLIR